MALESVWPKIVGTETDGQPSVCYPLAFSSQDKILQSENETKWVKGVELMEAILEELGVYRGWDGWVNHTNYAFMKVRLENCLEHF